MTTCQLTNEGPQRSPTLSFSVVLAVILIALASFSVLVYEPHEQMWLCHFAHPPRGVDGVCRRPGGALDGERQDVPAISRSVNGEQPS